MSKGWLLTLGANSDIAIATSRKFAREGWNIILASRNIEALAREASHLRLICGIKTKYCFFDANDFHSHKNFYASIEPKPDGVLLAFGMIGDQSAAEKDFEAARSIIETNYLGAVSILQHVANDFESRKSGFIIGISSVAGDRGRSSNYVYGSAKAGFSAYMGGLRHRLSKSDVLVVTVKPGFVETKMTAKLDLPTLLRATPMEVADDIYKGVVGKKSVIYTKKIWRFIMMGIMHMPEKVFNKTNL